VHQAIQDGVCQGGVGDLGKPVGDRHLGSDDGRCLAVAIIQNFQDVLGVGRGELIAQPIIENEEVGTGQGAQEAGISSFLTGLTQGMFPVAAKARYADDLDEARREVEASLAAAAHDPATLERIEERLFALRAAARKHNVAVDSLAALAERAGEGFLVGERFGLADIAAGTALRYLAGAIRSSTGPRDTRRWRR